MALPSVKTRAAELTIGRGRLWLTLFICLGVSALGGRWSRPSRLEIVTIVWPSGPIYGCKNTKHLYVAMTRGSNFLTIIGAGRYIPAKVI